VTRPRSFDAKLEALIDEANTEQLRLMYKLSGFVLRRELRGSALPPRQPRNRKALAPAQPVLPGSAE
jgi:hypothetical protein